MVIEGATCELAIWDTAGQERFHSLGPIYYRNADAALLVFDVTDPGSFRRVRDWVKELRQMVGPNIALSIAANKQDLVAAEGRAERAVPDDRSRAFAQTVGAAYYRTSAKTGAGIEQAFTQTAQEAFKHHQAKKASTAASTTQQTGECSSCDRFALHVPRMRRAIASAHAGYCVLRGRLFHRRSQCCTLATWHSQTAHQPGEQGLQAIKLLLVAC
mmetsp:Transcript_6920/g.20047  ORF Transcript_6920/g.20047 Transcript_6920/m.20047 type:complete len:215 (-) Transcript_6920:2930-3574(-)